VGLGSEIRPHGAGVSIDSLGTSVYNKKSELLRNIAYQLRHNYNLAIVKEEVNICTAAKHKAQKGDPVNILTCP